MKMPEPIATVEAITLGIYRRYQYQVLKKIPDGMHNLYDKQALIDLLDAAINSYSPDDTAMDYINKLIDMKETL
jgi:hypothetical protein